ncbi:MAG: hypothetical protein Kow0037_14580 [Calditrichia bacterium]
MENATTLEDIMGKNCVMINLLKNILEYMLEAEMANHLVYEKSSSSYKSTDNRRNGSPSKRIRSKDGEMDISIPRDRNGEFEPILIKNIKGSSLLKIKFSLCMTRALLLGTLTRI